MCFLQETHFRSKDTQTESEGIEKISHANGIGKKAGVGNSVVVQRLGLCAFTAKGLGSIPGQGTKIPQTMQGGQKQTNKQES